MSDPEVVQNPGALAKLLEPRRKAGARIGLVPTMGALHEGHTSLIRQASADNDIAVVTLFVNPAQFSPGEDLDHYPRSAEGDYILAGEAGADFLFQPGSSEIYPDGYRTFIEVEGLSELLCGASRPGHFRGVATVVWKLLQLVEPDAAYFGAKDAQQLVIIRKMVRDLGGRWRIVAMPTVRDQEGLALSSRNDYLDEEKRRSAAVLWRALGAARGRIESGERRGSVAVAAARQLLDEVEGIEVEYVECVSLDRLEPVSELHGDLLIALAVRMGGARLIDNICLRVSDNVEEILP